MADDIKLVIKISEMIYKKLKWLCESDIGIDSPIDKAIANGIPLTESDDYVSRKEALHSICKNCEWYQGFKPTCIYKCDSYKRIMKLPSVQPIFIGTEVLAWMPLPEPYNAESEDK